MQLTQRQQKILNLVTQHQPISGNQIASELNLSKSTIRSDLALLTHIELLLAKPKVGYIINEKKEEILSSSLIFDIKVKDLKSTAVCVKENISLHDAIIQIFIHDAGTIFVTDENEYLTGVVSRKDFLKSILGNTNIHSVPVSVIMTRMPNIITTTDEENIGKAAKKIIDHKIDALPVIKEISPGQMIITGRISKTTISKHFVSINKSDIFKS